jgi:aminopeptidase N
MSEERVTLSAALTGFRQKVLNEKALRLITSEDVRLQDTPYWIAYSFTNRFSRPLTWKWLTTHWDWIKANLGSDHAFSFLPIYSARSFSEPAFLQEYKIFFESVMEPSLARSYKQGVEMIEWQSAWKERALKEAKTFFKAQAEKH